MKRSILFAILILMLTTQIFAAVKQAPKLDNKQISGRYQLFQGTYSIGDINTNNVTESKDVFKIDTVTGKAWVYMTGIDENQQPFEFWRLIEDKKPAEK